MRILVADDEPIEREALRVLLQRHLPHMTVVGEAGSGRQAVEMAEALRPDIVLMDIEMPGLNGLEALREIRSRVPGVRCLVVSAYDHFHFAQEALRLGAADYLLKPVKRDTMVEVLRRIEEELAAERQERQAQLMQKELQSQLRPVVEAELTDRLIQGASRAQVGAMLQFLGLSLEAGFAIVAGLRPGSFPPEATPAERPQLMEKALSHLKSVAHGLCTCAVGNWRGDKVTLFVELDPPFDEYRIRLWSLELARRLRDRVKEQTGLRLRFGIGEPYTELKDLARSAWEALMTFRVEEVSDKVNHFGDLVKSDPSFPDSAPPPTSTAAGWPAAGWPSVGTEAGPADTWRPTPAVQQAVERGIAFIREHYTEEISLERVAGEVNLTPYYYSKIFKRLTGETVGDYLTRVRMERAKELLANPNVSIKEACFAAGYNDPNYFSRVFKKVTGQTPSEYRAVIPPNRYPGEGDRS